MSAIKPVEASSESAAATSTTSVGMTDAESRTELQQQEIITLLKRQIFLLEVIANIDPGSTEDL